MGRKWKAVLAAAALVVVLGGAYFLYGFLSDKYGPAAIPETEYEAAPDFTVYDADGDPVKLSDFLGKPVVVNLWASWCGPCKQEMPLFQELYEERGEEVEVLMVNLCAFGNDNVQDAKDLIAEEGYTFPVYFDTDGEAMVNYVGRGVPVSIFVDAGGGLAGYQTGALTEEIMELGLERILPAENPQD